MQNDKGSKKIGDVQVFGGLGKGEMNKWNGFMV